MPSAAHPNEADDVLSNLGEETLATSWTTNLLKNDKQSEHDQANPPFPTANHETK